MAVYNGLLIPRNIMIASDLHEYEQVIVTKIHGNSFCNRTRTIAITDDSHDAVTVCGSLTRFLSVGDLTCVISETTLDATSRRDFEHDKWAIFDVGFNPKNNID